MSRISELWLAVAALGLERNRAAWARGTSSNSYGNKGTNLNGACGPPMRRDIHIMMSIVRLFSFLFSDTPSPKHAKTISGVPYEEDCCRSYSSTRRSTIPINSPNPSGPAKPIEPIRWARGNKGRWPRTRADSGFAGRPLGRKVGPRGEAAIRRSFESSALPKTIQNVGTPLPRVRRRRGGEIEHHAVRE